MYVNAKQKRNKYYSSDVKSFQHYRRLLYVQ